MSDDRRKFPRKYLTFFGRVFERDTGQLIGQMADVTPQGAMIISGRPLELDQDFQLRLDLPETIFEQDHMDFDARSVWCQPDLEPSLFNTGFQLLNMTPEKVAIVEQIIKEFGIRG
ncbi:MAG: PilZ domain-containing protein [Anaerolineales bacterium]|nr:PilZ domain-containing protein [Anaerolineales bacterium]